MRILTKKILRDIWYQKGRSLSIIVIIALAMGLYAGVLSSYYSATDAFNTTETQLNLHSVRYQSNTPINASKIDLSHNSAVTAVDSRLAVVTSVQINHDNQSYTSPYYGIRDGEHPKVSDFLLQRGRLIQNSSEVLLEDKFMDSHNIQLGSTIHIDVGSIKINKTVVGAVFSPEFIYKVNPKTGLPDLEGVCPVWGMLKAVQSEFHFPGVNEILVRFTDNIHKNQKVIDKYISQVKTTLENEVNTTLASTELTQEADQQMKEGDVGALDDFARVFGTVVLLIALFAIYDNISKLIANQRNYIGTMRALGGSKWKVTRHYSYMAGLLSVVGVLIGVPLSWLIEYGLIAEYTDIVGIPLPSSKLYLIPMVQATSLVLGMAFLISVLSSIRVASITPREAMSSSFITQVFHSKPIVERILGKISSFEPTTAIPIRNIFRNKKKSLLTILTFSMSILLMTSALAFIDSFNYAIDQNFNDRQKFDMQIYYTQPIPASEAMDKLQAISGINQTEPFMSQTVSLDLGVNSSKTTSIYAYPADSKLRHYDIKEGKNEGVVVSGLLADEINIKVGESVHFSNTSLKVDGIANELISESIFMPLDQMQTMTGSGNNITGSVITLNEGVDQNKIQESIKSVLPVAVIVVSSTVKESIQTLIQGLFAMIAVMVLIGLLTVALFSFNTVVLEILSRENEFVNLKSLGSSKRKMLKVILIQSLIVSITGSIIAIPLSYFVANQVIQALMAGLMEMKTVIAPISFAFSIGAALIASFTGILAAYRHVINIDLVAAMRNRISN